MRSAFKTNGQLAISQYFQALVLLLNVLLPYHIVSAGDVQQALCTSKGLVRLQTTTDGATQASGFHCNLCLLDAKFSFDALPTSTIILSARAVHILPPGETTPIYMGRAKTLPPARGPPAHS